MRRRVLDDAVSDGRLCALILTGGSCMIAACTAANVGGGETPSDAGSPPAAVECAVDGAVAHLLQGASPTDCGVLEPGPPLADVVKANSCVREESESERVFRFTVFEQGFDSVVSTTYVGTRLDDQYVVVTLHFDSGWGSPTFDTGSITWSRCTAFSIAEPCSVVDGGSFTPPTNPCVSCQEQDFGECQCDEGGGISCEGFEP